MIVLFSFGDFLVTSIYYLFFFCRFFLMELRLGNVRKFLKKVTSPNQVSTEKTMYMEYESWCVATNTRPTRKKMFSQTRSRYNKSLQHHKRVESSMDKDIIFKECVGCGCAIEKDGGCNLIDCPNCKTKWCWICLVKQDGVDCSHC